MLSTLLISTGSRLAFSNRLTFITGSANIKSLLVYHPLSIMGIDPGEASTAFKSRAGCRMLSVYIASTTMAPSSTSVGMMRQENEALYITFLLTEVDLRLDDTAGEAICQLDGSVNSPGDIQNENA